MFPCNHTLTQVNWLLHTTEVMVRFLYNPTHLLHISHLLHITLYSLSLLLHVAIGFSSVIEYYVCFSTIYVVVLTSFKIANQLKRVLDQIKICTQLQIAKLKISSTEVQ